MSNTVHVEPVNDLIEHEDSDGCVCGPTVEPVPRDDGSTGWLVIHHSLDGRETREGGQAAPRPAGLVVAMQREPRRRRLLGGIGLCVVVVTCIACALGVLAFLALVVYSVGWPLVRAVIGR